MLDWAPVVVLLDLNFGPAERELACTAPAGDNVGERLTLTKVG